MALKDYDTTDIWKELKRRGRGTPTTYRQMYHKLLEVAVELLVEQERFQEQGMVEQALPEAMKPAARRKWHERLVKAVNG